MKAFAKILIISACFELVGAIIAGVGVALGAKVLYLTVEGNSLPSRVKASAVLWKQAKNLKHFRKQR